MLLKVIATLCAAAYLWPYFTGFDKAIKTADNRYVRVGVNIVGTFVLACLVLILSAIWL